MVLGSLTDWVADVVHRIGDVPVYWLVLALALKTVESALIGLTWRNILRAAYPKADLSFKTAWGASQGGTAINAVAPAQAGTATMIGIFRSSIPGSSVAGVTAATVVQALFFTVASILLVIAVIFIRPNTVSKGSPSDETGGFLASHPVLIPLIVVAILAVLYFAWPKLKPKLVGQWHKIKEGAAIFRDWRRYAREVAAPSAASYGCRIGVSVVFMAGHRVHGSRGRGFPHAVRPVRDHARRRRPDPGSGHRDLASLRLDQQRGGLFDHAGLGADALERRAWDRSGPMGVRLRSGEGDVHPQRPKAGARTTRDLTPLTCSPRAAPRERGTRARCS
jgi:Lysylphosphatidylglycerol synthase TM region